MNEDCLSVLKRVSALMLDVGGFEAGRDGQPCFYLDTRQKDLDRSAQCLVLDEIREMARRLVSGADSEVEE